MGNVSSRPQPLIKDSATNTKVSLELVQDSVLVEIKSLPDRISEIDTRLMKAENETDRVLQQIEEHDACSMRLIETYRKLAQDIKSEKDKIIEQFELHIVGLKQQLKEQDKSKKKLYRNLIKKVRSLPGCKILLTVCKMSDFWKEIKDLEETVKQIELEKSNLIQHLQRQDKHLSEVVYNLKSAFTSKVEKLQLEIEKLKFALTKSEGEETPAVFKLE